MIYVSILNLTRRTDLDREGYQTPNHFRPEEKLDPGKGLPGTFFSNYDGNFPGVSIIFKIPVFYKAQFEGFEFFIGWPYAVFHKMQVVFYKSAHFMYL